MSMQSPSKEGLEPKLGGTKKSRKEFEPRGTSNPRYLPANSYRLPCEAMLSSLYWSDLGGVTG